MGGIDPSCIGCIPTTRDEAKQNGETRTLKSTPIVAVALSVSNISSTYRSSSAVLPEFEGPMSKLWQNSQFESPTAAVVCVAVVVAAAAAAATTDKDKRLEFHLTV